MKLKIDDKVYCKKTFWDFYSRENWVDKFTDQFIEVTINDFSDFLDSILHTNYIRQKKSDNKKKNIIDWMLLSFELSLMLLPSIAALLVLATLFLFANKKRIIFKKGEWYKIKYCEDDSCAIEGIYPKDSSSLRNFYFVKTKKIKNHQNFYKYFADSKGLRKLKLDKLYESR